MCMSCTETANNKVTEARTALKEREDALTPNTWHRYQALSLLSAARMHLECLRDNSPQSSMTEFWDDTFGSLVQITLEL